MKVKIYIATINVFVVAASEAEACDGVAEMLRPNLREFAGKDSDFIDWGYVSSPREATNTERREMEYQP